MNEKKAVFIIPGFRHSPSNIAYKEIAKIMRVEGHLPIPVKIPWRETTISQNTKKFLKKFKKNNSKKKFILGFSYGAMIAFLASTKVKVSGLILCSLSPYFKEDLEKVNYNRFSKLSVSRYEDFSTMNCKTMAKKIKTKNIRFLYGTKESKALINRVTYAFTKIPYDNKYLIPIKKTAHDIGARNYLNTIHQIAKELV